MQTVTLKGKTGILDVKWNSAIRKFRVFFEGEQVFSGTTNDVRGWMRRNGII